MVFTSQKKQSERFNRDQNIPYKALALIYDNVMQHVEYKHWAKYIKKIIETHTTLPQLILDIGCGTGQFIYYMKKLGIQCEGCDPSPEMLKYARKKNPRINFRKDQLPDLENIQLGEFSIMTCLYDTINYLPTETHLKQSLNRIYQLLPENGLFIFDAVSEIFCQHYFNGYNEEEVLNRKYAYTRDSYFDPHTMKQMNRFSIYTPYGIFEEEHIQQIYPFRVIKSIISNNTKFQLKAIYQDFTFLEAEADSNRAHFVLKK